MPSHDSSASQRATRILDAARASALSDAAAADADPELDDVWPDTWPPGRPVDPVDADRGGGSGQAGLAGRISAGLGPGARWEVSARAAAAAVGVLVLVVALVVVMLSRGPSPGAVVPAVASTPFAVDSTAIGPAATGLQPTDAAGVSPAGAVTSSAGQVRVYVVGQVQRPGVVSLAAGARVEDAVDAAGGSTGKADLAVMNLARKVVDGERIVVPRPGEKVPTADPIPAPDGAAPADGQAGTSSAPGTPVDLNTATVADLDALPGVGPVIAGRIVAWRQQNGNFKTVDDLGEVSGIGDATLEKLRPLVRV
jgi:competence protein ComEA